MPGFPVGQAKANFKKYLIKTNKNPRYEAFPRIFVVRQLFLGIPKYYKNLPDSCARWIIMENVSASYACELIN